MDVCFLKREKEFFGWGCFPHANIFGGGRLKKRAFNIDDYSCALDFFSFLE